jgi:N-acetylmuramoyl-L-alanine amidase
MTAELRQERQFSRERNTGPAACGAAPAAIATALPLPIQARAASGRPPAGDATVVAVIDRIRVRPGPWRARPLAVAAACSLLAAATAAGAMAPGAGRAVAARRFAPGSCIAFKALGPRRPATVFIDAGHGGPDPGAVGVTTAGQPVHEADETLRVVLDAVPLLRERGYRVVVSRTTAGAVARPAPGDLSGGLFTGQGVHHDLVARDACANRSHAALLIGVYFNAVADAGVGGSVTLYDASRPFWRSSRAFALLLQRDVLARLRAGGADVPDDGVHNDVGYGSSVTSADRAYQHLLILGPAKAGYFSSPSLMPGALIEPLFITDPVEASAADSRRGQRAIAQGLARAAAQFLGARRRGAR